MGLDGCVIVDHRDLDDTRVRKEAAGKNRRICSRATNLKTLYRRRADGGFQQFNKVVGPRTHPKQAEREVDLYIEQYIF